MTHKQITWTSWNAIADDYIESIILDSEEMHRDLNWRMNEITAAVGLAQLNLALESLQAKY